MGCCYSEPTYVINDTPAVVYAPPMVYAQAPMMVGGPAYIGGPMYQPYGGGAVIMDGYGDRVIMGGGFGTTTTVMTDGYGDELIIQRDAFGNQRVTEAIMW